MKEDFINRTGPDIWNKEYILPLNADYQAIIVETREVPLEYVIKNHLYYLGEGWGLTIYCGDNYNHIKNECTGIKNYKIIKTNIASDYDYNNLLTSIQFWSVPYKRVLIFQHDSLLLRQGIEDYLQYDYVGAPWAWRPTGFNGGLSLRNPKAMLTALKKNKYTSGNEDVFFSNTVKNQPEATVGFSCEQIFQLNTMGVHAVEKWLTPDQLNQIYNQNNMTRYKELCDTPSDINELLPHLYAYSKGYKHITEMGTRRAVSTYAFLESKPRTLICYDIARYEEIDQVEVAAKQAGVKLKFHQANVLDIEIEPTDFLFIDTFHTAEQLSQELKLHADKVKNRIAFHDTTTFWNEGEIPYEGTLGYGTGLKYALEPFLTDHPEWSILFKTDANNGLTVIEKI